jgi:nucleoside-diphosphate-sugar epimerase
MKCIVFGGTGEVGKAVVRALLESEACDQLTLLGRREVPGLEDEAKVVQIVVDTNAPDFEEVVKEKAQGHDVGISCIGVGSGTSSMTEEEMAGIEVHLMAKFARGCKAAGIEIFELLTAVGSDKSQAGSLIKYTRVMGKKHKAGIAIGFSKLAIFMPGTIVGNAHTPRWVTPFMALIPDSLGWGNIHVDELGRAFAAHLEKRAPSQSDAVVTYDNKKMKELIRE